MDKDFDTSHLTGKTKKIADDILAVFHKHLGEGICGGGCRAFYSPKEWKARGEDYGTDSLLVVVYDGGDFSDVLGSEGVLHYPKIHDGLDAMLRKKYGAFLEPCTCWYSAVYKA